MGESIRETNRVRTFSPSLSLFDLPIASKTMVVMKKHNRKGANLCGRLTNDKTSPRRDILNARVLSSDDEAEQKILLKQCLKRKEKNAELTIQYGTDFFSLRDVEYS